MAIQPVSFWARFDSNSANNPALNLTKDDAVEITFLAETSTGGLGDLHLDAPSGGGVDPDTQISIAGTTYSFTFELTGTLPTQKKDGAQQVPDQYEGSDVVVITVQDYPTAGDTTRVAFMPSEAATEAEMNNFGNGAIDIQNLNTSPPSTPICFVAGTLIETPEGPVPVEALCAGDLVMTLDEGARLVRWVGRTRFEWSAGGDEGQPILIRGGALGPGLPARDLRVSPQHRILITGDMLRDLTGSDEAFVPAKALIGLPGVRRMRGARRTTYHHLLLDRHAVLGAERLGAESFFPGPMALAALAPGSLQDLRRAFPGLGTGADYGPLARPSLRRRAAEAVLARGGVSRTGLQGVPGPAATCPAEPEPAEPAGLMIAA